MKSRVKKILLLALAAALLFGSGQVQKNLERDRHQLGLTIGAPLQNAPPLLAFTTVALGGFRGLISNYLWIRANNLQLAGKYYEAAQLANWITDLEPHFAQVWNFQAWNMAYNISVKFKENSPGNYADRWRWVRNGIDLLRDRGLRWNPDNSQMYFQLGWIFEHKIGENLDDGNLYYKQQWAQAMSPFFGPHGTNFAALIHPQTAEQRTNALVLRDKYKINPVFAQQVNQEYGPLDWRLPEAHAIYWYALGLKKATNNPNAVAPTDFHLMQLRRGIFQSEQQAFRQGRMIVNPFTHSVELAPDLDLIPKVNAAYLQMYNEETNQGQRTDILRAQRNFLRYAIYYLYYNDRITEAAHWFKYLGEKFPNQPIIDKQPHSYPRNVTLDQYAVAVAQENIDGSSQQNVTSLVQGLLTHAYVNLAIGQDERAAGLERLAQKVRDHYQAVMGRDQPRAALPPMNSLKREVLNKLLDTKNGLPYAARAVIRSKLGMPAETVSTNAAPPAVTSTNATPTATNSPMPAVLP